jgi:hypothetical protein
VRPTKVANWAPDLIFFSQKTKKFSSPENRDENMEITQITIDAGLRPKASVILENINVPTITPMN